MNMSQSFCKNYIKSFNDYYTEIQNGLLVKTVFFKSECFPQNCWMFQCEVLSSSQFSRIYTDGSIILNVSPSRLESF